MHHYYELTVPAHEPVSLNEVRSFLRLETDSEDARLAALIATARAACEMFIGSALISRTMRLRTVASGPRFYLRGRPIQELLALSHFSTVDETVLDIADHPVLLQGERSYICLPHAMTGVDVQVDYRIGMGADWNAVPEPLRQGILRLVVHHYETRSDASVAALPKAVTALWQPYRSLRI